MLCSNAMCDLYIDLVDAQIVSFLIQSNSAEFSTPKFFMLQEDC